MSGFHFRDVPAFVPAVFERWVAEPKPVTFHTEYMGVPFVGAKVGEVIGYDRGGMERYARIIRFEDGGAIVQDLGHKGRERYLKRWRVLEKPG